MHLRQLFGDTAVNTDMLRLQQSQVTLTQNDVDNYKRRCEEKRVAQLMGLLQDADPPQQLARGRERALPVLKQGAQRSRDEAVVHSTVADPVAGDVVDVSGQICSTDQANSLAEKGDQHVRRDSLLSYEESETSGDTSIPESPRSRRSSTSPLTPSPPARRNAVHGRRNSAYSREGTKNITTSARRYRPRSFSDPCEAPVLSVKPRRCLASSPADVGLCSVPEDSSLTESDKLAMLPPSAGNLRARHHSLPEAFVPPYVQDAPDHLQVGQIESQTVRNRLPLSTLHSTGSPLEALGQQLSEYTTLGWTTDLPTREQPSRHFAISDDAETSPILPQTDREAFSDPPSPSRTISDDELNGSGTILSNQRQSIRYEVARLPELAIGRGGRPRVGSLSQPTSAPIRRRNILNTEQENEESMHQYQRQRDTHRARAQGDTGGVLETTPPPLGRLERLLR